MMCLTLILFQFLFVNLLNAKSYKPGYAVQIKAYASDGYYYLEDGETSNGDVVFSRRTTDPRYIYKLPNGEWHISKTIGATGSFAHCSKSDIRDCNADEDDFYIEYYISAYASSGVYFLTSQLSSGKKVYSRGTSDERYIYRYGNAWFIGRYIGQNSYFSLCQESNLESCSWLTLCVRAYASDGIYQRTDEIYNDREVYERTSDGDKRVIYYNSKGYGWIIAQFAGGGYFAYCNKQNIRGCDDKIKIEQCSDTWSASNSLPQPIWFNTNNYYYGIAMNIIISVISTLTILLSMYCCCKICIFYNNNNNKQKYKTVLFHGEFQEDPEEIDELQRKNEY